MLMERNSKGLLSTASKLQGVGWWKSWSVVVKRKWKFFIICLWLFVPRSSRKACVLYLRSFLLWSDCVIEGHHDGFCMRSSYGWNYNQQHKWNLWHMCQGCSFLLKTEVCRQIDMGWKPTRLSNSSAAFVTVASEIPQIDLPLHLVLDRRRGEMEKSATRGAAEQIKIYKNKMSPTDIAIIYNAIKTCISVASQETCHLILHTIQK